MAMFARKLWQMQYLRWVLLVIAFYTLVLFIKNFAMYLHTGEAVAIHGRYLIPVFPALYLMMILAFSYGFERLRRPELKTWLVIVTTLLLVNGGGITVWIRRSDAAWSWPQSQAAIQANQAAKKVLHYTTIGDITLWRGPWYPPSR